MRRPALFLLLLVAFQGSCSRGPVVVTVASAVGAELTALSDSTRRFMKQNPNILINIVPTEGNPTDRLQQYRSWFEEIPERVDVMPIDVTWTSALAEHAIDLRRYLKRSEVNAHFESIIENNTVGGKLVGIPWFVDLPLLYYRTDLLKKYDYQDPPSTWEELEAMAKRIQEGERLEDADFWGYVWQGQSYEGLACNALEWQKSNGGGELLSADGRPAFNNPKTAAAMERASSWVSGISPPDVVTFDEERARAVWQRGQAAFMRNWSYAWALSKADLFLESRVRATRMPSGEGGSASTLGGWQLMVSRHSGHPREAAMVAAFLASEREQRLRSIDHSYAPSIKALYKDPDVLRGLPFFVSIERMLSNAVARPARTTEHYESVSKAYWQAVHDILNGASAAARLSQAEKEILEIRAPAEEP